MNYLSFIVYNEVGPTGLRVDMTGYACNCDPGPADFPPSFPSSFDTGLTDSNMLLGDNAVDPHFTTVSSTSGYTGATKTIAAAANGVAPAGGSAAMGFSGSQGDLVAVPTAAVASSSKSSSNTATVDAALSAVVNQSVVVPSAIIVLTNVGDDGSTPLGVKKRK